MNDKIAAGFAEIEPARVDETELGAFDAEKDFIGVLVDLLIEAGSYLCVSCNIYPSGRGGWNRNEAIIGGHLIRLYKLIDAILDQTVKHRRETSFILTRLHFETAVNAQYLMNRADHDLFDDFVRHSLFYEKGLRERIEKNISERGGEVEPIEDRMLKSIARAEQAAQISLSELPAKKPQNWGGKNLFEKTRSLGLESTYHAIFSNASASVHGNWGDLYQHHLTMDDKGFHAKIDFSNPRPQHLETAALFSIMVVSGFIDFLGLYQERAGLLDIFQDFEERVRLASRIHEQFLQNS